MDLDERKQKILQAIIQDYITSAEPVGSRTIARKYNLGVSAATIRNEMFDLEMLGYLEQPHTSAGRIPSIKGYRFYVDCLLEPTQISDDGGQEPQKTVTVRIGEEANLSPINDCSIIEATFKANDVVLGKIAVLGPTRMEYAKIIGLLDFMKQHVTNILEHYHDDT